MMRNFTKLMLTAILLVAGVGGVKADERVALSTDIFKSWKGSGKDAESTGSAGCDFNVNTALAASGYAMVYGDVNVYYLNYADISDYTSIEIEGTSGLYLRFLFNREIDGGATIEKNVTLDGDGKAVLDIHSMPFAHLNAIKTGYDAGGGKQVTKITLVKEVIVDLVDGFTELTQDMCHSWTSPDANATITGNAGDYNLNVSRNGGGVVYGGNVPWSVYADISAFTKMVIMGTPGSDMRVMYNRQKTEQGGDGDFGEIVQRIDANGVTTYDLTTWGEYAHLNSIKIPYSDGYQPAIVNEILLLKSGKEIKTVAIGSSGYCTYVPAANISLFKVKGYKAKYEGGVVKLTQVDAVPSGEAVVIEATQGYYALPVVSSASSLDGNELLVSDGTVTGGSTIYALSDGSQGIGFYQVDSSVTIPAGKAYLVITGGLSRKFIGFDDNSVTDVVSVKRSSVRDNVYYDLQGRRVVQPKKGVYVRNGKKLFVK